MPREETTPYNTWSPWYAFSQLFEYRGLIAKPGETLRRKTKVKWKGSIGFLHRDNGFRLRSFNYTRGSFSNIDLAPSLEALPCPLSRGDLGVYWLRIKTPQRRYNYIGCSHSKNTGIFTGLVHQFTNMAGTSEYSSGYSDTNKFKVFREGLGKFDTDTDLAEFLKENVEIAFIKVTENQISEIVKIREIKTQEFKEKFGYFPELNSRDEKIGLEGMPHEK